MPSWRDPDPKKRPAKAPTRTEPGGTSPKPPDRAGWRDHRKAMPVAQQHTFESEWQKRGGDDDTISRAFVKKWSIAGLLFLMVILGAGTWYAYLHYQSLKLPLYVVCLGSYEISELRENPYGDVRRKIAASINPKDVAPFGLFDSKNDNALGSLGTEGNSPDWIGDSKSLDENRHEDFQAKVKQRRNETPCLVVYINCFARIQVSPKPCIELFHQTSQPFHDDADERQVVDLQVVLENIATFAKDQSDRKENCYAWVILDLQLPPVVSNLGDLSPPWYTAAREVLNRITDRSLRDRLILTLPADDDQNNWLAPEHSASFFGHHVFKLLDNPRGPKSITTMENILGRTVNLKTFQENLKDAVLDTVQSNRYAVQTPVWIAGWDIGNKYPDLEKIDLGLKGAESGGKFDNPSPIDPSIENRFEKTRELWREFMAGTYRDAYRWDPLGYARVESQLIALEEIAVEQPGAFEVARFSVENALQKLYRPPVELGASLVEDDRRREYYLQVDRDRTSENHVKDLIGWLTSKVDLSILNRPIHEPQEIGDQATEDANADELDRQKLETLRKLGDYDQARVIWGTYIEVARGGNEGHRQQSVFSKEQLDAAIQFLRPHWASPLGPPLPVEIYLLSRLAEDLNWSVGDDFSRRDACSLALVCFESLQSVAAHPDPWIGKLLDTKSAEENFLWGFDLLLAEDYNGARSLLERSKHALAELSIQADGLSHEIQAACQTFPLAAHLVACLFRQYQFAGEVQELDRDLSAVGKALRSSFELMAQIEKSNAKNPQIQILIDDHSVSEQLDSITHEFRQYVKPLTAASTDRTPNTFRRSRIALSCPLLTISDRESIHGKVLDFLRARNSEANHSMGNLSDVPHARSLDSAREAFFLAFAEPPSSVLGQKLEIFLGGDLRYGMLEHFKELAAASAAQTDSSEMLWPSSPWIPDTTLRLFAGVLGNAPSHYPSTMATHSKFALALDRWKLLETTRRVAQAQRLAQAGWGDGDMRPQGSEPVDFYFGRLANCYIAGKYAESRHEVVSNGLGDAARALMDSAHQELKERVSLLQQMKLNFGLELPEIDQKPSLTRQIEVAVGKPWNAKAAVFLSDSDRKPVPWRTNNRGDIKHKADLAGPTPYSFSKDISSSYWKSDGSTSGGRPPRMFGNLAVRGNTIRDDLDWHEENREYVQLQLVKRPKNGATVRIEMSKENQPIMNVVILLDCSLSMGTMVPSLVENDPDSLVPLFSKVTADVESLLNELEKVHGRDANVHVCLIPFGINYYNKLPSELRGVLSEGRETIDYPTREAPRDSQGRLIWGHFYPTAFKRFEGDWPKTLREVVESLKPESDTPMYAAILEACRQISRQMDNTETSSHGETPIEPLIFVFSDGVDQPTEKFTLRGKEYKGDYKRLSYKEVVDAVQQVNARLKILHYDYFSRYIESNNISDSSRNDLKKWDEDGREALKEMNKNPRIEYGTFNVSQAMKYIEDTLNKIRTRVSVARQVPNGQPAEVPGEWIEGVYVASIESSQLPGAFIVTSQKGQQIDAIPRQLVLAGGEKVRLGLGGPGRREFTLPKFENEVRGWSGPLNPIPEGGGFTGNLWFWQPEIKRRTEFNLAIQNKVKNDFTIGPGLVVAMLSDDRAILESYVLADHDFADGEHYPKLTFPTFNVEPWPLERRIRWTLWVADQPLSSVAKGRDGLHEVQVHPNDSQEIKVENATVHCKLNGSELVVTVTYADSQVAQADRVVLLCPDARVATRRYAKASERRTSRPQEEHAFELNPLRPFGEIQITTVGRLDEWTKVGLISKYDEPSILNR